MADEPDSLPRRPTDPVWLQDFYQMTGVSKDTASATGNADRFAKNVAPIIKEIQSSGIASHRAIARALNARGVATARGGQ